MSCRSGNSSSDAITSPPGPQVLQSGDDVVGGGVRVSVGGPDATETQFQPYYCFSFKYHINSVHEMCNIVERISRIAKF